MAVVVSIHKVDSLREFHKVSEVIQPLLMVHTVRFEVNINQTVLDLLVDIIQVSGESVVSIQELDSIQELLELDNIREVRVALDIILEVRAALDNIQEVQVALDIILEILADQYRVIQDLITVYIPVNFPFWLAQVGVIIGVCRIDEFHLSLTMQLGGPTGHIGRPGYGPNRAHPNNGILVGPGGEFFSLLLLEI